MNFLEIKGMLARLLAQENLIVEHSPHVETASFNVATRVMTLPVWETESEEVYNLFVSHEVGHALWTPVDFPDKLQESGVNASLANIIEDARIEKLIQKKFPGLRKDYSIGYAKILDKGMFGVDRDNIDKMGFIDRVNLHYKVGAQLLVPFTDAEKEFLERVDKCQEYTDIIEISKEIQDYVENKSDFNFKIPLDGEYKVFTGEALRGINGPGAYMQSSLPEEGEPDYEDNTEEDSTPPEDLQEEEVNEDLQEKEEASNEDAPPVGELDSETQAALEEAMRGMLDRTSRQITYLNAPTYDLKEFIFPIQSLRDSMSPMTIETLKKDLKADEEYAKFMVHARRDVNHMVQQFDMRKAAEIYSRVQINTTGMLNTSQLHNYKLTDDIFLRQEIAPIGKSHGMVMLIDWSGSMDHIAFATIKQILILAQFCRKIQIPFKVYTFTSGKSNGTIDGKLHKNQPCPTGTMVEVLTSNAKRGTLEKDFYNLFLVGYGKAMGNGWTKCDPSSLLSMGGTPLSNSLFTASKILEEFKEETRVDKISFVVITDGDSGRISYYNSEGMPTSNYGEPMMIRGLNGSVHKIDEDYRRSPGSIAKWISETQPNVSVTNIFLGAFKQCSSYHRGIIGWGLDYSEESISKAEFTKNNGLYFTTKHNWPLVALMNPASFSNGDEEIAVEDGVTTSKIRTAFKKFLNKKSGSKKVLTAIVESFA